MSEPSGRSCWPPRRSAARRLHSAAAFSLVELLVVMGLISLLLTATLPGVTSLLGSFGRQSAVSQLMATLDQVRAAAVTQNAAYLVVFTPVGAQVPEEYRGAGYAVFRVSSAGSGYAQVTPWTKLPKNFHFDATDDTVLGQSANVDQFKFAPTGATLSLPYLKFNALGAVQQPTDQTICNLRLAQTVLVNGTLIPQGQSKVRDLVSIQRFTGRARYQEVADAR